MLPCWCDARADVWRLHRFTSALFNKEKTDTLMQRSSFQVFITWKTSKHVDQNLEPSLVYDVIKVGGGWCRCSAVLQGAVQSNSGRS